MVEHRRNRRHKVQLNAIETTIMRRLFLVPALVVLSFIILVAVPDIVYHFLAATSEDGTRIWSQELDTFGVVYAIQSLISVISYMVCSSELRKLCVSWLGCTVSLTNLTSQRVVHHLKNDYEDQSRAVRSVTPKVAFVLPREEKGVKGSRRESSQSDKPEDKPKLRIMMVSQV